MKKLVTLTTLVYILVAVCKGSPESNRFRQEIIGKCLYYQSTLNPGPFVGSPRNCTLLWEHFRDAFAFQPVCNVSRERYRAFLDASFQTVPVDKSIFWEHVYQTVIRYSNRGQNLFSIADTFYGFIADSIKWCGNASEADGIERDRSTCPGYDINPNCASSAEASFWTIASEFFSKTARGNVKIMLNAEGQEPFADNSYFAQWELPNLQATNVSSASILMIHSPSKTPSSTCDGSSVTRLRNILKSQGVPSTCTLNQMDIKFLLCSENPSMEGCECASSTGVSDLSDSTRIIMFHFIGSLLVYIFLSTMNKL